MLKWSILYVFLVGIYGVLGGCATSEEDTRNVTGTEPIDYKIASNQVDDKVVINGSADDNQLSSDSTVGDIDIASADLDDDIGDAVNSIGSEFERKDYRIGPDDLLDVQVFGVEELSQKVRVNSVGTISLPLIGEVQAAGLLSQELEDAVEAKLAQDYMQNPIVNIYIEEFASQRVTIGGEVEKPGVYALRGPTTLLQAVAMAGGLAQLAETEEINIIRKQANNQPVKMTYNLEDIQGGQIRDPDVKNGDYVFVGTSETRKFLRDSVFRDVTDFFNPFRFLLQ